jgi:WhiB family redox-sensing transcriptional regulator
MRTRDDWMSRAFCLDEDPELFFPIGEGQLAREQADVAKALCARCEVRRQCVSLALAFDAPFGVWGGLDPLERKRIRRRLTG